MSERDAAGRKQGHWQEEDPHGGMIEGEYVDDKRHGLWTHHFTDGGVRSQCHYEAHALSGEAIWYRQGGGLMQKGGFLRDEKHGYWQRWTATGALIDEGTWEHGTKTGEWTYYNPDGSVKKKTTHRSKV